MNDGDGRRVFGSILAFASLIHVATTSTLSSNVVFESYGKNTSGRRLFTTTSSPGQK